MVILNINFYRAKFKCILKLSLYKYQISSAIMISIKEK